MLILDMIFGSLLLFAGRKLFWLAVAVIGFFVGMDLAPLIAPQMTPTMSLLFALCCGLAGMIVAIAFEWVGVVVLIGFVGGGYLLTHFFPGFVQSTGMAFLIGGLLGMFIVALTFEWALIGMTSLVGAMLIIQPFNIDDSLKIVLFAVGVIIGVLVQSITTISEDSVENEEQY